MSGSHQDFSKTALGEAAQLMQEGELQAAGAVLEALVGRVPDCGPAWLALGQLALTLPDFEAAADFFGQAALLLPEDGRALELLGDAQRRCGELESATVSLEGALALLPNDLLVSCKLANCYVDAGELFRASRFLTDLMARYPGVPELYLLRGLTLAQMGELKEAKSDLRLCLSLAPQTVLALATLADIYLQCQQQEEAVSLLKHATDLAPDDLVVLRVKGELNLAQRNWREAEHCLAWVLEHDPDNLVVALNRAVALVEMGDALPAIDALESCLARGASEQWVYEMLGVVFAHRGQWQVALESLEKAVAENPDNANAWNTLTIAYNKLGQMDKAEAAGKKVLELDPQHVSALINLAGLYIDLGRHDDGVAFFQRALKCDPTNLVAYAGAMFGMLFSSRFGATDLLEMGGQFDERVCLPLRRDYQLFERDRNVERPLRIGWLSSDLRAHPVGAFMQPVFPKLDAERYESYVYDNWPTEDRVTALIKPWAKVWRSVRGLGDGALAESIRADEIDILVDLNGHTAGNRLGVFARKPAPIQVEWLGFPGTSGMSAIDYVLVPNDPFLLHSKWSTEEPWALPNCYGVRGDIPDVPVRDTLPCQENGYFTFACMNRFSKVSTAALDLWGTLLARVPDSRLILIGRGGDDAATVDELKQRFREKGVVEERLIILASLPVMDYFATYNRADLCLDPFPFNGGTTGFDSIWMGVPFVTLRGDALHSRAGSNILKYVGLEALIAESEGAYVDTAAELAINRDKLRRCRESLRQRMQASPLLDNEAFARGLENAFRGMWMKWCQSGGVNE